MGRGQYDRAAAKAKRQIDPAMTLEEARGMTEPRDYPAIAAEPARQQAQFARPAWPYLNPAGTIVNPHGQYITQADYDALITQRDRLLRLCQTHGLMIDG